VAVFERVWRIARQIPRGKVATYGQIARIVGTTPRAVGFAMAACPASARVPWQRVVNARGEVSARAAGEGEARQRRLLREEGIALDRRNRVDLSKWSWLPLDADVSSARSARSRRKGSSAPAPKRARPSRART
jgi:methylated-DNA-protein-cysteine methyltransferase-like protein